MWIKRIHIDHFGKFRNYDLRLDNALTILYGNNEDGKSTLMAFIQMMFYGFNGRVQDLSKNPRKRYKPWDGRDMKGLIEFAGKAANFRLERSFRASNATDEIRLWNLDTGEVVALPRDQDPGQLFFGLGAEAFEKSVFIGQSGSVIEDDGKSGEITQRLLNLVTTGNESVSYRAVEGRLKAAEESLVSKSERKGLLVEARQRREDLRRQKIEAVQDEVEKAAAMHRVHLLREEKVRLEMEKNQLDARLRLYGLRVKTKAVAEALRHLTAAEDLHGQQKERRRRLQRNGEDLGAADLTAADRLIAELLQGESQQEQLQMEWAEENQKLQQLQDAAPQPIDADAVKSVQEKLCEMEAVRDGLAQQRENIRLLDDAIALQHSMADQLREANEIAQDCQDERVRYAAYEAETVAQKEALRQIETKLNDTRLERDSLLREVFLRETAMHTAEQTLQSIRDRYDDRIHFARQRSMESTAAQKTTVPKERHGIRTAGLAGALLLIAAAIALALLVDPLAWLLLLPAAAVLAFSLFSKSSQASAAGPLTADSVRSYDHTAEIQRLEQERDQQLAHAHQKAEDEQAQAAAIQLQIQALNEQDRILQDELPTVRSAVERAKQQSDQQRRKLEMMETRLELLNEQIRHKRTRLEQLWPTLPITAAAAPTISDTTAGIYAAVEPLESACTDEREDLMPLLNRHQQARLVLERREKSLQDETQAILARHHADSFEQLISLDQVWRDYEQRRTAQNEVIERLQNRLQQLAAGNEQKEQAFLAKVSSFEPVTDRVAAMAELENWRVIQTGLERTQITLQALQEKQSELEQNFTAAQLQQEKEQLEEQIQQMTANEPNNEPNGEILEVEQQNMHSRSAWLAAHISELGEQIASAETSIREKFRHKKNVSQIEEEMTLLEDWIEIREADYDALRLARKTLEDAFAELQRNFGPIVNDRTADIFNRLTNGKYNKVLVSRNLEIMVEDCRDNHLHEWGFLSSGTIDQAYLSLRLAIADLVTKEQEALPLLLDDVFSQYDDARALEGLRFLEEYRASRPQPIQILLFTCHNRIANWARHELQEACIQNLLQE